MNIPRQAIFSTACAWVLCLWPFRLATAAEPAAPPPAVLLWSGQAPGATGDADEDKPAIYPYLPPAEKNTGAAVLICPGGGFMTRCADYEGVVVAQWLKARGIAGFILRYRIRPIYGMKESLADAQRGLQVLRAHAEDYRLAPGRIGIIGFSAGATLAGAAGSQTLSGEAGSSDRVAREPSRPDFVILAYGSLSTSGPGGTERGMAGFPPAFLFGAGEDASVTGMTRLFTALRKERIPVEAHFFAEGPHGVGFAEGDPVLGEWPGLALSWMRAGGFLTGRPRVAVRGVVRLEGEPLPRGCLTFTPLDGLGAPPVTAYVLNTGPVRGEFVVEAVHGLTPGRHRVEVRQDALHWLSNSRNPMMVKMNRKQRDGTLTEEDRREWNDYARKRNLAPEIDDVRVFRHARASGSAEIIVEIKAGAENRVDLDVSTSR